MRLGEGVADDMKHTANQELSDIGKMLIGIIARFAKGKIQDIDLDKLFGFLTEYARIFQSVVIVSAVLSFSRYTPLNVIGKLRCLGDVDPYFDCISSLTAKDRLGPTTVTLQNVKNRILPCSTVEFTYTVAEMNLKDKEALV